MITQRHIIPETVIFHYADHPLHIRLSPVLHIRVSMIQITRAFEITARVCIAAGRRIVATRTRIGKSLVALANMRTVQLISAIRTEIVLPEITPVALVAAVVNHYIRQHFRVSSMQGGYQLFQFRFRSPVADLFAQLFMGITHTAVAVPAVCICAGRKPY